MPHTTTLPTLETKSYGCTQGKQAYYAKTLKEFKAQPKGKVFTLAGFHAHDGFLIASQFPNQDVVALESNPEVYEKVNQYYRTRTKPRNLTLSSLSLELHLKTNTSPISGLLPDFCGLPCPSNMDFLKLLKPEQILPEGTLFKATYTFAHASIALMGATLEQLNAVKNFLGDKLVPDAIFKSLVVQKILTDKLAQGLSLSFDTTYLYQGKKNTTQRGSPMFILTGRIYKTGKPHQLCAQSMGTIFETKPSLCLLASQAILDRTPSHKPGPSYNYLVAAYGQIIAQERWDFVTLQAKLGLSVPHARALRARLARQFSRKQFSQLFTRIK